MLKALADMSSRTVVKGSLGWGLIGASIFLAILIVQLVGIALFHRESLVIIIIVCIVGFVLATVLPLRAGLRQKKELKGESRDNPERSAKDR